MSSFHPKYRNTPGSQVSIALYRIMQAINFLLRERGKGIGLSPAQIQSLLFLKYVRPTACTIGGLADGLGVTYATSSGIADALERKGLIQRLPLLEDQRVISLRLTLQGNDQTEQLENLLEEVEASVNSLSDDQQAVLLEATRKIVRQLQHVGYLKVYEICWHCQFFRKNAHPENPAGPHHCAFTDDPLPEPDTYFECPDAVSMERPEEVIP